MKRARRADKAPRRVADNLTWEGDDMGKSTRRLVKPAKNSSSISSNFQDPLRALREPDADVLRPTRIERADITELLLQCLSPGDDPPAEGGMVLAVAREIEALCDHAADEGSGPLNTLLHNWATRLRVAAELQRRTTKARAA